MATYSRLSTFSSKCASPLCRCSCSSTKRSDRKRCFVSCVSFHVKALVKWYRQSYQYSSFFLLFITTFFVRCSHKVEISSFNFYWKYLYNNNNMEHILYYTWGILEVGEEDVTEKNTPQVIIYSIIIQFFLVPFFPMCKILKNYVFVVEFSRCHFKQVYLDEEMYSTWITTMVMLFLYYNDITIVDKFVSFIKNWCKFWKK